MAASYASRAPVSYTTPRDTICYRLLKSDLMRYALVLAGSGRGRARSNRFPGRKRFRRLMPHGDGLK